MRTELLTPFVEVSGGRSAIIRVEVHNTTSVIDGVSARVAGIDPAWVRLPIEVTSLFPDSSEIVEIEITLPRTYPAGRHVVAVETFSTLDATERASHHVTVDVAPAADARLEVWPRSVKGGKKAELRALVDNRGNRPIEVAVTAADTVRALTAEVTPPSLIVPPGETLHSVIKLAGRRPFYGTPITRQVMVQATSPEHQLEQTARFTQKPYVGRGIVTILVLASIVTLWAVIFTVAIGFLTGNDDGQKAVHALFITGARDLDGDGIISASNADGANEEGPDPKDDIDVTAVAGTISGAVHADTTGEGIPRLTVQAERFVVDGDNRGWQLVASGATDDSGAYELAGLLPGSYRVSFVGDGFVPRWYPEATTAAAAEPQTLDPVGELDLSATVEGEPGSVRGTVLVDTVEGAAAPAIEVIVREPALEFAATAVAAADGTYVVSDLPTPGNFEITFSDPDFRNRTLFEPLAGGENKLLNTIKLGAAEGSLAGTVTDGTGPLGGVAVRLTRGDVLLETTTPTSGGGIGTYLFPDLETPGTYVVTFSLEGYSTETQAVDLGPGESLTGFDVQLIGGAGSITGGVTDAAGNPLAGVSVTVSGMGQLATAATLSAGAPGSYTIGDLPTPGTYTVTFSLAGYLPETRLVTLDSGGPLTGVDVSLASAVGTITGTVLVDDSPTGGVSVTLNDGQLTLMTTTESGTGNYRFTDLEPGSYTVTAEIDGRDPTVELVTVDAGDTLAVDLAL